MINKILLVGAGELGSRHLQSLLSHAREGEKREVCVFDPSEASLELTKIRASQVDMAKQTVVEYSQTLNFSVLSFDLVVIATNAAVRLRAIKEVLSQYSVNYFLLEKILFQNTTDLIIAERLITEAAKKAWVNCPRRHFPSYKQLSGILQGCEINSMVVTGNRWGMACNSVHFLDLWFYLAGIANYKIDISRLSNNIIESKRSGFKEIEGEILCHSDNRSLQLICTNNENLPISTEITIQTDQHIVRIDEINGSFTICNRENGNDETLDFTVLYQSQMTGHVASDIYHVGECDLTPFSESSSIHAPFLSALLQFFQKNDSADLVCCPIT